MANPEHLETLKQGAEQWNKLHCRRKLRGLATHFVALSLLLSSCNKPQQQTSSATASGASTPPATTLPTTPTGASTKVLMHNVILIERPGFQLRVRWLRGQMRPTHSNVIPSFDEPNSFVLDIEAGVIATSLSEISALLNGELLKNTPLENVALADEGNQLRLNGTLHKGIPLPIEMTSKSAPRPTGESACTLSRCACSSFPSRGCCNPST